MIERILPRYIKTVINDSPANFQIAKRIVVEFDKNLSNKQLWSLHAELTKKFYETKHFIDQGKLKIKDLEIPRFSLLDLKIILTEEMMKSCELCERNCRVNRAKRKVGECKVGDECLVSSEFIHMGEEPFISPSHTIFFMGCNFHCQYCQNFTISQWYEDGFKTEPKVLARLIEKRREDGSRNVNFVGGEPTPSLIFILQALKFCKANIPVVWNSNFYMSEKTMKILDGLVDLYLPDFKYGNDECALRLSKVPNYFEVCSRNHLIASNQAELAIRHLLLPNHFECCTKPILEWISKNIKDRYIVNIMDQYRPAFMAKEHIDINRGVTEEELEEAVNYAKKLNLNYIA